MVGHAGVARGLVDELMTDFISQTTDHYTVGIMVAHPDDETLWMGGMLLLHPEWSPRIFTLCRGSDADRSPRFFQALQQYRATGAMGDLDDSPEQDALPDDLVQRTVMDLLGGDPYDIVITHAPTGEYTWHRRHAEVSRAVMALWLGGRLQTKQLWCFAYEDDHAARYPLARMDADFGLSLPPAIWDTKYRLIHEIYGFAPDSWEARTTPRTEAFWRFSSPEALTAWLHRKEESR